MNNKQEQFNQIYIENKEMVYRLCLGYLGKQSEVEDLFQEVFLKIWQYLDTYRGEAAVSTWIYRIATNTALQYRQKRNRQSQRSVNLENNTDLIDKINFSEPTNIDYTYELNHLLRAIRKLKKIDRLIITLALEGFSYIEIGDILGLTVNHVGVKINRIKQQLKKQLSKDGRFKCQ